MSSITPHFRSVQQLLHGRRFAIDEYQREYKWERRNIEELLSDLTSTFLGEWRPEHLLDKASGYSEYFLGSIIVAERDGRSYLVDGQQRVTSLTLLLIYLYRGATERGLGVAPTVQSLIYADHFGKKRFNLDVEERIDALDALFNGTGFDSTGRGESVRTLVERYGDIEQIDPIELLGDSLEAFIYWLLNRVGLIEIVTTNDAHANAIFETMNDRGKPLSPVDMLKAYLLGPITDPAERTHANDVWKKTVVDLISWADDPDQDRDASSIKAWLRSQYAESVRERKANSVDRDWELLGTNFHRWVRDNSKRVGAGTEAANRTLMTQEFPFFARAYRQILEAGRTYTPGLESIYYNANNQFSWQSTVLLASLSPTDSPEVVTTKLGIVSTYLDIWITRRVVNFTRVGYSSTSYAMYLLAKDIRRASPERLVEVLTQRLAEDDFQLSGSRDRNGLSAFSLNSWSKGYILNFLARLTAFVEVGCGMTDRFPEYVDRRGNNSYDIEHLWADKYEPYANDFSSEAAFESQRNRIAGLVLLPAALNRSLQAKPYEDKVSHYVKENLYAASLNSQAYEHAPRVRGFIAETGIALKPYEHFGPSEQAERHEIVRSLAERVWSPARLTLHLQPKSETK